jgi:hypothetical protein
VGTLRFAHPTNFYASPDLKTLPDGQIKKTCPAPCEKIFRFGHWANQWFLSARLTRQEGRLAIVTKRAVGCGGCESCD